MSNIIKLIFSALLIAMLLYAASGYYSASRDVAHLKQRARTLIDAGRVGDALGTKRIQLLLLLQDPNFYNHCLLYTFPSPRDQRGSRMPSSA